MKICTKCKIEKDESEFYRGRAACTACKNKASREYNKSPKFAPKLKELKKLYYQTEKGKSERSGYNKNWRKNNLERKRGTDKKWATLNKEENNKKRNERYHTDPLFNLKVKLRRRISVAIGKAKKGTRKADTSIKLLGCSFAFLKEHIESQFTDGMTWDLVLSGDIHLDHIVPVDYFDLTDPEQQRICFGWENLQPLWALDNLSKNAKLPDNELINRVLKQA